MYLCIYQSIHGLSGLAMHWQKCKLTMGCATPTRAHVQLIASFPWTPVRRTGYSHPQSIHRDVRVGLWNYIRFAAGYRPIPVVAARSLCCSTGHTIAASPLYSPLALESRLDSLLGSLLERATLDKAVLRV